MSEPKKKVAKKKAAPQKKEVSPKEVAKKEAPKKEAPKKEEEVHTSFASLKKSYFKKLRANPSDAMSLKAQYIKDRNDLRGKLK
jgi:hypothetical protein|tara:strand:- start:2915 stop:3166 length:252 start_codon:yes stop_codon:yes gene_type:complete